MKRFGWSPDALGAANVPTAEWLCEKADDVVSQLCAATWPTSGRAAPVSEKVDNIEQALDEWKKSFLSKLEHAGLYARNPITHKWKAPFRSLVLRESIAWRAHDLLVQAHALHKAGQTLGSRILIRSALETLAVLIYLNQMTASVIAGSEAFHQFSLKTSRLLLGSKDKTTKHEAINILTVLRENLGKRLIKSPKVYIADSGLACHLLGISSAAELDKSPFLGSLFEGFIAAELVKAQLNAGLRRELYYFRDQQGLEVDFITPGASGTVRLLEAKATATPTPGMTAPMRRLAEAIQKRRGVKRQVEMTLVYRPSRLAASSQVIAPGVKALTWQELVA